MSRIFLNPGHHPGVDPGAVFENITEADVVRQIGFLCKAFLERVGVEVKLIQSDNLAGENPCYENVCEAANGWPADLFVSIHCNAAASAAQGSEALVYNLDSRAARLASRIQQQIVDHIHTVDRGVKARPDLIVLKHTAMPAVLIECGFISNEEDRYKLIFDKDEIAASIARGITDYLSKDAC